MIIILIRIIILYALVFAVIRLSGKRQLSQLQPFDLVITLLIADLVSLPVSDPSIPLAYGIVPIATLFLLQKLIAWGALKSKRVRTFVCGKPLIIIDKGKLVENTMRQASYSVQDLFEHLRTLSVFAVSDVQYAILETNGDLSVLLKANAETVKRKDIQIQVNDDALTYTLVVDGNLIQSALKMSCKNERWLRDKLKSIGIGDINDVFYAQINQDNVLCVQTKEKVGARTYEI